MCVVLSHWLCRNLFVSISVFFTLLYMITALDLTPYSSHCVCPEANAVWHTVAPSLTFVNEVVAKQDHWVHGWRSAATNSMFIISFKF